MPALSGLWVSRVHLGLGGLLGTLAFAAVARRWRELSPEGLRAAVVLGVAGRVALLCLPPLLSEDLWRYLWDGAVQHHGLSPYAHAPNDPALDALAASDPALADIRGRIGHPHLATIYPPAAQAVFWLVTLGGPSAMAWRVMAVAFELGAAWVLFRWLRREGRDPRAVALWLLCPLAAVEGAVGAHVDTLGVLALSAALAWPGVRAGLALAVAAGTKLFPLLVLPRLDRGALLGLGAGAAGLLLFTGGEIAGDGLAAYGHRWRANDGLFALLVLGFEQLWPPGTGPLEAAPWVLGLARGLVGGEGPLYPDEAAFAAAKLVAGLAFAAVVLERWRRGTTPANALGPITAALLLLSPVVHPWYLLWLLPFAIWRAGGVRPGLALPFWIWTGTVWIAYIDPGIRTLEYLPVWIALASAAPGAVNTPRRAT